MGLRQGNIWAGWTAGAVSKTVDISAYMGQTIYIQLYTKLTGQEVVGGTGRVYQFASQLTPNYRTAGRHLYRVPARSERHVGESVRMEISNANGRYFPIELGCEHHHHSQA